MYQADHGNPKPLIVWSSYASLSQALGSSSLARRISRATHCRRLSNENGFVVPVENGGPGKSWRLIGTLQRAKEREQVAHVIGC